ncbi:MAG: PP2C family protein-serine/threonine phosphatase [Flavobacteriales bacterium]
MNRNILLNAFAALLLAVPLMVLIHLFTPKYKGGITIEHKDSNGVLAIDINGDGRNERIQFENINGKEQLYSEVWSDQAMVGIWQTRAHLIKHTLHTADIDSDRFKEILFLSVENDSIFGNALSMRQKENSFSADRIRRLFLMKVAGPDFDIYSFQSELHDLNNDGIPELVANINQGATIRGIYAVDFATEKTWLYNRHFIHFNAFSIIKMGGEWRILATSYANGNIPQNKVKLAAEKYGTDTLKAETYLSDWQSYIVILDEELQPLTEPMAYGGMFSMQRALQRKRDGKILSLQSGIADEDTVEVLRLFDEQLQLIQEREIHLGYDKSKMTKYDLQILYQIGEGHASRIIYIAANDSIMEIDPDSLYPKFLTAFPEVKKGNWIREFDLDRDGVKEVLFLCDNGILVTRPDLSDPVFLTTEGKISSQNPMEYTLPEEKVQGVRVISKRNHYLISYSFNFWWYWKWVMMPLSVGLMMMILLALQKVQSRKLEAKNRQLEAIVTERTREITHQKELIEEKQKEILDSITYAKRIQEAILPSRYSLVDNLKDGFVLYKPKDIVAGDFYWLESYAPGGASVSKGILEGNRLVYVAAADCTGHGVPGAMVSVICSNALSKTLLEEGITEPGRMLDRTRELVVEKLSKSGEEVKDGMDISLLRLDHNHNVALWSGANNPLWIFRNNDTFGYELLEIKPDKQPIGKYADPKPFTTHIIELKKGDTLYLFTDGFQDQFGGEKGKKLKAAKLKELLLGIQYLDMDAQKQKLESEFETWRGDLEQNDDVCLIGVRF